MSAPDRAPDRALARALSAWGEPLPDWIAALAGACDARSLRKAAADLKISPALASLALRNVHHAPLGYIEGRVRALLTLPMIPCPVLGLISARDCEAQQQKPFTSVNPLRVQVYRACHGGCLHSKIKEEKNDLGKA